MALAIDRYGPSLIKQYLAMAKSSLCHAEQMNNDGFAEKALINGALWQLAEALKWHLILALATEQRDPWIKRDCSDVVQGFTAQLSKSPGSDNACELLQLISEQGSWLQQLAQLISTLSMTPSVFNEQQDHQFRDVIATTQSRGRYWSQQTVEYYVSAHSALSELIHRHFDAAIEN